MNLNDLRSRIARADYDVDIEAVAEALVARVLAVHGALRRADVRELLGDVCDEIGLGPQSSCS